MTSFNRSTRRRLQTLNQIPSVWEGDRRVLKSDHQQLDAPAKGECIVWVDGSQGIVRAMDVVTPETGPEAIVRTLMRAMEHPHSPGKPARPQKIIVKDREVQFFLRGVLQGLDITVDYAPELPLIDDMFRSFAEVMDSQTPELPPDYAQALYEKAFQIWQLAPWEIIEEQQILAIEINQWDVGTLYASIMGMLGMEFGILFYREQDSLKRFRASVLDEEAATERLEEAFLKQDCLFLTFDSDDDSDEDDDDDDELFSFGNSSGNLVESELRPCFGNIHPLEGLRSVLYEEEALAVFVALEALHRFIRDHRRSLVGDEFPSLSRRYRIAPPKTAKVTHKQLSVTVSTMPELAAELEEMAGYDDEDSDEILAGMPDFQSLRDDLIPEDSFLSLGVVSWEMLEYLRQGVKHHQQSNMTTAGDGLPVVLIQTSRPKAQTVIENIAAAGGLKAICFNPGADPLGGESYDLGLLQTENNELFLFGEFLDDDPVHVDARKKWNQRCKSTHGYCGLIIAKGLTGAARGNPQLRDMMALFEARSLTPHDLGIGTLQLMPQAEFE
ncbi:MAG: hypothetical protein VKL59_03425 [Nostocaceae cyanobacterium]|nr:hypothetical protein [Nostocaceae cyanobacterium]